MMDQIGLDFNGPYRYIDLTDLIGSIAKGNNVIDVMKEKQAQVKLRLPEGLKNWAQECARAEDRSVNWIVVKALEAARNAQKGVKQ